MILEFDTDLEIDYKSLESESRWGDFRLYELKRSGRGSLHILLQPLKTGLSVFSTAETLPFMAESEFQIQSRLGSADVPDDKNNTVRPLIRNNSDSSYLIIVFIIAVTAVGLLLFFVLKKRKRVDKPTVEKTLKDYLLEAPADNTEEKQCLEFYLNVYRLLLKDLAKHHPSVTASDSPSELLAHLEEPSSLNQWALRSLYPLLEDLNRFFFAPEDRVDHQYKRNLAILTEWVSMDFDSYEKEKG